MSVHIGLSGQSLKARIPSDRQDKDHTVTSSGTSIVSQPVIFSGVTMLIYTRGEDCRCRHITENICSWLVLVKRKLMCTTQMTAHVYDILFF